MPVKISPAEVLAIRQVAAAGNWTHKEIAAFYKVAERTIYSIVKGHSRSKI
jgi:plasmid maintenance system antidote protein VapI